jgi:hypothetical protein
MGAKAVSFPHFFGPAKKWGPAGGHSGRSPSPQKPATFSAFEGFLPRHSMGSRIQHNIKFFHLTFDTTFHFMIFMR